MQQITVYLSEKDHRDEVVVISSTTTSAKNAILIALRENFGEQLRIVRQPPTETAKLVTR